MTKNKITTKKSGKELKKNLKNNKEIRRVTKK